MTKCVICPVCETKEILEMGEDDLRFMCSHCGKEVPIKQSYICKNGHMFLSVITDFIQDLKNEKLNELRSPVSTKKGT